MPHGQSIHPCTTCCHKKSMSTWSSISIPPQNILVPSMWSWFEVETGKEVCRICARSLSAPARKLGCMQSGNSWLFYNFIAENREVCGWNRRKVGLKSERWLFHDKYSFQRKGYHSTSWFSFLEWCCDPWGDPELFCSFPFEFIYPLDLGNIRSICGSWVAAERNQKMSPRSTNWKNSSGGWWE